MAPRLGLVIRRFVVLQVLLLSCQLVASETSWRPDAGSTLVYQTKASFSFSLSQKGKITLEKSEDKGAFFVEKFLARKDGKTFQRIGIRRLDKQVEDTDGTVYQIVKYAKLIPTKEEGVLAAALKMAGKSDELPPDSPVWMAVGEPGTGNVETIWISKDWKVSMYSSGMLQMWFVTISERLDQ